MDIDFTFYILLLALSDLPDPVQANIDNGSITAAPSPHDCVCLIKRYMGSKELSQRPLLVLTAQRAGRVGMVPTEK